MVSSPSCSDNKTQIPCQTSTTKLEAKYPHKPHNTAGKMLTVVEWEEVDGSIEVSDGSGNTRTPKLPVITH